MTHPAGLRGSAGLAQHAATAGFGSATRHMLVFLPPTPFDTLFKGAAGIQMGGVQPPAATCVPGASTPARKADGLIFIQDWLALENQKSNTLFLQAAFEKSHVLQVPWKTPYVAVFRSHIRQDIILYAGITLLPEVLSETQNPQEHSGLNFPFMQKYT